MNPLHRPTIHPLHHRCAVLCLALLCAGAITVRAAAAITCQLTVTSTADSGPGTLRDALACASNGDTIDFNLSGCPCVITLTSGELVVSNNVIILGPGAGTLAVDGNFPNTSNRVFSITATGNVTISSLTISNGFSSQGGGIANSSILTVSNCAVTGNSAFVGGGIFNTFRSVEIVNSTLSGNSASGKGGGVLNESTSLRAVNSTLSGNKALFGGGLANASMFGIATSTVFSCTFSDNSANIGGSSIYNDAQFSGSAVVVIGNSILSAGASVRNIQNQSGVGLVRSLGHNIYSQFPFDPGIFLASGDFVADPKLGPLADNGGPTLTHALLCDSPAIDWGTNLTASATDQRGFPRLEDTAIANFPGGDGTDVGAVEFEFASHVFTVLNLNDHGPGSLRTAVSNANVTVGIDIIQFDPAVHGTITLTSGELLITDCLFVNGPGVTNVAVSGNATNRVFNISPDLVVSIYGLTISNGLASGSFPDDAGGGIYNDHSKLTVSNCAVTANTADFGGGIYSDGEMGNASLNILNSTLSSNSTVFAMGGGVFNDGSQGQANLDVEDTTLSGNSALTYGGGIFNDGQVGDTFVQVSRSTLSGNAATVGGGLFNDAAQSGTNNVNIMNSTFSGNTASSWGGAMFNDGQSGGSAELTMRNLTLSGNSAPLIGGIYNNIGGHLNIGSFIFNNGATGGNLTNVGGSFFETGHNLSDDNGGGLLTDPTDIFTPDPRLGPLQDNGGPTFTHALLCDSPAIDHGQNNFIALTDQRGFPRTFDDPAVPNGTGSNGTDIGAFEVQHGDTPPTIQCSSNLTVSSISSNGAVVTFPAPVVSDDCPGATASCTPPSGSTFPLGTNTVSCTATDVIGQTSSCSFTVTVLPADLAISKAVVSGQAKPGQLLVYTIIVTNVGPGAASGVVVNDPVPQGTTFYAVSTTQGTSTAPPLGAGGTATVNLGTLANGAKATITLTVKVSLKGNDKIVNTTTVTSSSLDPNLANNTATVTSTKKPK